MNTKLRVWGLGLAVLCAAALASPSYADTASKNNTARIAVDRPVAIPITGAAQSTFTATAMTNTASIGSNMITRDTSTSAGGIAMTYAITAAPRASSTSLLAGVPSFYGGTDRNGLCCKFATSNGAGIANSQKGGERICPIPIQPVGALDGSNLLTIIGVSCTNGIGTAGGAGISV